MNARPKPPQPDALPEGEGRLNPPPPPRSPWQLFYGAVHRARQRYWAQHALSLPVAVVSVGNLHWGGGGKTPLVAAIAARLMAAGRRPAILSRGWGRARARVVRVVSDGRPGSARLGPHEAGDEPSLLAELLPEVPVLVGADRHAAGLLALRQLAPAPDLFILDDGFSHLRLRRDVDLLALPAADPFGGGKLVPGGRLREPLAAAARAHGAMLTGAPTGAGAPTGRDIERALAAHGFHGRGFVSATITEPARTLGGAALRPGTRALLVAAVARPESFAESARAQGLTIAGQLFFRDHHDYPAPSLARIAQRFRESRSEVVLVTAKDAVKLRGRLAEPLAVLPIRAEPEPAFWDWLAERSRSSPDSSAMRRR